MTYELRFLSKAQKEWDKLDSSIRAQFVKKLRERLEFPRVPKDALHGLANCYKIKLRTVGYRLVYRVEDQVVTVTVIAVGRRAGDVVYDQALDRLQ